MKKTCLFVASAVVCASMSVFADGVQGGNVFGVMAVESGTEYTIVAVPWCECATNDNQAVAVSNIVKTANLEVNDMVYVVDNTGKFNAWKLQSGAGGVLYWNSVPTASLEGLGTLDSSVATAARGSAIILYRQHPKDGDDPKKFYLYGQVGTGTTVVTPITPNGSTLIAPPYYAADGVDILASGVASFTPLNGDKIIVRKTRSGSSREYTYKSSANKWYYEGNYPDYVETQATEIKIPCGAGAWYITTAPTLGRTITWNGVPSK